MNIELENKIVALYPTMKATQIAKQLGYKTSFIRNFIRTKKMLKRRDLKPYLDDMLAARLKGYSIPRIAIKYKVSITTITKLLKKNNLTPKNQ